MFVSLMCIDALLACGCLNFLALVRVADSESLSIRKIKNRRLNRWWNL